MDKELLLDIFAFCPEKYFVHKVLVAQTRVTFVDYERKFYRLIYGGFCKQGIDFWHVYQEYGPSINNKSCYCWMEDDTICRKNGPSVIFKEPQKTVEVLGRRWLSIPIGFTYIDFFIPKDAKLKALWMDKNRVQKAKVIEDGVESIYQKNI